MPQKDQTPPSIDDIREAVSRMLDNLNPTTPISATVVFKVNKQKEGTFVRNAEELATATRKLPGCSVFVYQKHKPFEGEDTDPVEYLVYENWEKVQQFKEQWNSDHIKRFQYGVGDWVVEPPELDFYYGWHDGGSQARILKTGQTKCWDAKGALQKCAGTGQDGDFQLGLPVPKPRFYDNADGTVTDSLTGLVWLKNANLFGEVRREEAFANVKTLASGNCGLTDKSNPGEWRLPNVNELESLLDLNNSSGPALPPGHLFTNAHPANYWTSTSVAAFPALGWYVAMAVGPPVFDLKFNRMRMWPVRGESSVVAQTGQKECYTDFPLQPPIPCAGTGQDGELQKGVRWPEPRFTDNGNGTVTDNLTALIWTKDATPFGTRNWEEAIAKCNSLASGSYGLTDNSKPGEWRLPNINELRSLEDYGQHTPALPLGHPFKNVRQSLCWSSTTVTSAPNLARFLFVGIGSCVWDHKSVVMGVWPVRGGA